MRMMAQGEWVSGVTAYGLSDKWGIKLNTVQADSSEASRRLADEVDGEKLGQMLVATLMNNIAEARAAGKYDAVSRSAEIAARIAGVEAPKKVDVGGSLADILALGLGNSGPKPAEPVED